MSKKVLGKGIGALFKELDVPDASEATTLPVKQLKPNPYQPRTRFPDEGLKELADSIREKGIIQPLLVEADDDGTYTVIAGERRLRAAKAAGLKDVPVLVRRFSMVEKIEIALIENIQRENLTPVEEAQGYRKLMQAVELSQEQVARRVGKDRSTVANSLRLLKLPEPMLEALDKGDITPGHARAILSLVNPADQQILFDRTMDKGLSVREAEMQAQELRSGRRGPTESSEQRRRPRRSLEPSLEEVRQRLIDGLGTKVDIRGTTTRGKIEISYYSSDDLERMLELLAARGEKPK
ncbi:MAG: ParB/RepB/Spo0J family partition protein [Thermoleophilia bacterium]|nr:ParB/RepB/Spo0J family partition protein [Thermoleophilia bacterium]